nr:hypothetical protein Iba_chr14fCG11690 [Ipomoea batatas]
MTHGVALIIVNSQIIGQMIQKSKKHCTSERDLLDNG